MRLIKKVYLSALIMPVVSLLAGCNNEVSDNNSSVTYTGGIYNATVSLTIEPDTGISYVVTKNTVTFNCPEGYVIPTALQGGVSGLSGENLTITATRDIPVGGILNITLTPDTTSGTVGAVGSLDSADVDQGYTLENETFDITSMCVQTAYQNNFE